MGIFTVDKSWTANIETRELMRIHKEFHPRYDVDMLYVKRQENGRQNVCIKNCVNDVNKAYINPQYEDMNTYL